MTSPVASPWTEVMVSDLRRLWMRGDTCAQIGQLIGMTKNSVISKAHRVGLPIGVGSTVRRFTGLSC